MKPGECRTRTCRAETSPGPGSPELNAEYLEEDPSGPDEGSWF